jgi:hypothetical protein
MGMSRSLPGRFTPARQPRHSFWMRLGGPTRAVWVGVAKRKYLSPTGFRTPNRPAAGESLYRLRYVCCKQLVFTSWLRIVKYVPSALQHNNSYVRLCHLITSSPHRFSRRSFDVVWPGALGTGGLCWINESPHQELRLGTGSIVAVFLTVWQNMEVLGILHAKTTLLLGKEPSASTGQEAGYAPDHRSAARSTLTILTELSK